MKNSNKYNSIPDNYNSIPDKYNSKHIHPDTLRKKVKIDRYKRRAKVVMAHIVDKQNAINGKIHKLRHDLVDVVYNSDEYCYIRRQIREERDRIIVIKEVILITRRRIRAKLDEMKALD